MYKFDKCKSSFVSDEYDNLDNLLRDSPTLKTVNSLKSIQAIQILIPKLKSNKQIVLDPDSSSLSYFLNGLYNREDDSLKYVLIKNTPIHLILHPHFLNNFVSKGELHIQTVCSFNELDDHLTLTPDGLLLICVNHVTYTKLGLIGQLAYGYKKNFNFRKYIIELDLKDNLIYKFNSKYYQRTFNALKNCGLKLDLMIKWVPDSQSNCSPVSLIRFFSMLKGQEFENDLFFEEKKFQEIKINQCGPNIRKFELDDFLMPEVEKEEIDLNSTDEETFKDSKFKRLIDSFGLALSGSYLPDKNEEDNEVNTFRLDKVKLTNLICLEITGFLTVDNVKIILSELFELIKKNVDLEYAVLIVNGFENSIRSWSGQSNCHLKHLSGENLYGIFLSRFYNNFIYRIGDRTDFGIEKL